MSTRSAKRRRISDPESPNLPLPKRAFRAVKAALVGIASQNPSPNPQVKPQLTKSPSNIVASSSSNRALPIDPRITRSRGKRSRENASDNLGTSSDQEPKKLGKDADGEVSGTTHTKDGANGVLLDTHRKDAEKIVSWVDEVAPQSTPSRRDRGTKLSRSQSSDELQISLQLGQNIPSAVGAPSTQAKSVGRRKRSHKATEGNEDANIVNGFGDDEHAPQQTDGLASENINDIGGSDDAIPSTARSQHSNGRPRKQRRQHSIEAEETKVVHRPTFELAQKPSRPRRELSSRKLEKKTNSQPNLGNVSQRESPASNSVSLPRVEQNVDMDASKEPIGAPSVFSTPRKQQKKLPGLGGRASLQQANDSDTAVQQLGDQDESCTLKEATLGLQRIIEESTPDLLISLKTRILGNITGKQRLPLVNLDTEYQKVHQLIEQTVLAGEGNSMLVIGSRGTGKTTLVETVIADLAFDHREEFHIVRLNGFIHTDDKLALREIWRQLGREMEVEDSMGSRSNYADTLTSLLALLSHPVEADGAQDQTAKSVVFVIDEFDLFASHPRQTLLYNLFDVAQSRNAPIAVLGITTKIDVVESLEKRVKSRFGQRYVHLSLPKSLPAFQAICQSALIPQPSHTSVSTRLNPFNRIHQNLHSAWSTYISALFSEDPALQSHLLKIYTLSKSVPAFLTSSLLPIAALPLLPTGPSFHPLSAPDSKLALLPGLSDLGLGLLIAAARLDIVLDADVCNFNLCYDEYVTLGSRSKARSSAAGQLATSGSRVWSRTVARGAWESLVKLELVVPVGGRGEGMWRAEVALEEIGASGVGRGLERWCKEI